MLLELWRDLSGRHCCQMQNFGSTTYCWYPEMTNHWWQWHQHLRICFRRSSDLWTSLKAIRKGRGKKAIVLAAAKIRRHSFLNLVKGRFQGFGGRFHFTKTAFMQAYVWRRIIFAVKTIHWRGVNKTCRLRRFRYFLPSHRTALDGGRCWFLRSSRKHPG